MPIRKKQTLIAVLITFALSSLGVSLIFPILAPLFFSLEHSLLQEGTSEGMRFFLFGLFLAAFPFMQFLFAPLIGEFSDKKGRRGAYLFTTLIEALGYAISALGIESASLGLLFIGRLVTGFSAGNMSVCLSSLVDLSQTEKEKVRYFSYGSASLGVMFVLGPFIGGKLSDSTLSPLLGFSFPMWVGMILALVNFLVIFSFFRETLKEKIVATFDPMRAVHNIQLAFRTRAVRELFLIYFLFLFSWNLFYQFLPATLVKSFNVSSVFIGDSSAILGLIWMIAALCIGFITHSSKVKMKTVVAISLVLFSLLSMFLPFSKGLYSLLLSSAALVFFAGALWPIFTAALSKAADQAIQGKVLGLSQSIQSLAMLSAPLFGSLFLDVKQVPFAAAAIAALFAGALLTKAKEGHFQL